MTVAGVAESGQSVALRAAVAGDVPALEALIAASARELSRGHYTEQQTSAAIASVFGIDSELIADRSYFVAHDGAGALVGCGGWSRRRTLFGGDRFAAREAGLLDPAVDAARIRAFFVAPQCARRGIATRLLARCEAAARQAGFGRATLMATLPGRLFYARHGYVADAEVLLEFAGSRITFVPMTKTLLQEGYSRVH